MAERLGFDYFWGFLGGEAGQWDPVITVLSSSPISSTAAITRPAFQSAFSHHNDG